MDKEIEFYKHIDGLAMIYGKDMPKEAIRVYFNAIQDLTLEELKRGISLWLNQPSSPFFSPAQEVTELNFQVAQAQWKNVALTIVKNDRLGIQEKAPMLSSSEAKNKQIESMGAIIQSIGFKKS